MQFYLLLMLWMCLSALVFNFSKRKFSSGLFLFIWGSILFLVYFIKDISVGIDYYGYLKYFFTIKLDDFSYLLPYHWDEGHESGYMLLTHSIGLISQTDIFFTFVIGLLMVLLPFITLRRYAKPVWMGVFLFFALGYYTNSFSLLRQSLAMYITWLSIPFVLKRRVWSYCGVLLIAFLFHKTSIIFFPMYWVYNIKITKKYCIIVFIFSIIAYIGIITIMSYLTSLLALNDYLDDAMNGGYTMFVFVGATFFFCAFALRNNTGSPVIRLFMHMLLYALVLQFLATRFSILARIIYYYEIALVFLLPAAIWSPLCKRVRISIIFIIVVLFILYFYKTNIANLQQIYPYVVNPRL